MGRTMVAVVPRELADGQEDASAACLGGLSTKRALDSCLENWRGVGEALRDQVISTGDKLASTSGIVDAHDEDAAAALFRELPGIGGRKPN